MVAHNILLVHRVIYHFTESRAGNVRAEFLAYVTEFLTRGPCMYIIYMIGDEDGYDDDDDGDDVMIILPSPSLGKLGTLYVKYMHDFHLKGYMCSDILFRLAILVSCHLYLMLYILSTLSVLTPFPRGAAFHARRCRRTVR